jgi:hypothetical protein
MARVDGIVAARFYSCARACPSTLSRILRRRPIAGDGEDGTGEGVGEPVHCVYLKMSLVLEMVFCVCVNMIWTKKRKEVSKGLPEILPQQNNCELLHCEPCIANHC